MNEYNPTGLLFLLVLILSIKRSRKKLKTFLLSFGVSIVVSFLVLLSMFFLPVDRGSALGRLAADTGRMAGIMTAIIYSRKTRDDAPQSVYLIAISGAVCLLVQQLLG